MKTPKNGSETNHKLSDTERADVEERLRPRVPMLYEIIRKEGEAELVRPVSGLWWSGVAAGLCIGFSMVAEGLLRAHLPDSGWRPLVENVGYSVGFLIVVLGRQQLFTENTITAVLPVMAEKSLKNLPDYALSSADLALYKKGTSAVFQGVRHGAQQGSVSEGAERAAVS